MSEIPGGPIPPEEQATDLLKTARHVNKNVKEARRLWHVKNDTLNDSERAWIDAVIGDTEEALREIMYAVEPTRAGKSSKKCADMSKKATRIFRGAPKIRDKHVRLNTCHQSLTAAITCLFSKEIADVITVKEAKKKEKETPPPYDAQLEQLFAWGKHRKRGRSSVASKTDKECWPNSVPIVSSSPDGEVTIWRDISGPMEILRGSDPIPIGLANEDRLLEKPTLKAIARPFSSYSKSRGDNLNSLSYANDHSRSNGERSGSPVVDTLYLSPFISRPRANSLPTCRMDEQVPRPRSSYPMSPSDYSMRYPPKPTTKFCRSPLRTAHNSSHHDLMEAEQKGGKFRTNFSAADPRVARSRLITGYDVGPSTLAARDDGISNGRVADRLFQGSDGLQLAEATQPASLPYQLPNLSISSTSLCPSLISMPEDSDCGKRSLSDLPRLSIGHDEDQKQSAVEIGMASPVSTNPRLSGGFDRSMLPTKRSELLSGLRSPCYVNQAGMRKGSRDWLRFHAERTDAGFSGG